MARVTRTNTLTEDVVRLASEAGLRKLSIGIEHISAQKKRPIKSSLDELEEAAKLCNKYGITLVGLLMLGYPNQTVEDVKYILSILKEFKIHSYRFTGYTPLHKLRNMTVEQLDKVFIEDYDRRTFYAEDMRITPNQFYDILISTENV
jgi:MoaA/NifB/PqqE/SkfB family radical SAM enzyme